MKALSV